MSFLNTLTSDQIEKFLHSVHFYWAHDVFRNCRTSKNRPLDIFSVLTTLSIAEFLMKEKESTSWKRINNFFNNYLRLKEELIGELRPIIKTVTKEALKKD